MVTVKLDGTTFEMGSVSSALAALTGDESLLLEEYIGGWDQLGKKITKSAVVMVWLALRVNGQPRSLEEIQAIPGIAFGDILNDDGIGEPEDPMRDPGRPLVTGNASNGSTNGSDASEASAATSVTSGPPA